MNNSKNKLKNLKQKIQHYEMDNKKISVNSPMSRGLIGKSENDVVEINSPKGIKFYTVISVKFQ